MKIGINFEAYGTLESERTAELLKKNGFGATFVMAENSDFENIMRLLEEYGVGCETLHAPFDGINNIWLDGFEGDKMLKRLKDSVDRCAGYRIPVLVVHLSSGLNPPPISDKGIMRFDSLIEYAGEKGITVAFENQRLLGNIAFALERYENAGFCWDVGHEKCFAHGRDYMALFSDRTAAVHIHDNFFEYNRDLHLLPFDGKIDFEAAVKHLAASPYKKSIMLEALRTNSNMYDALSCEEYFKRAAEGARKLVELYEKYI